MSQRRYTEKEIASIFKQASEAQEAARQKLQQGEGLTLEEIAAIGKEAGITPEFIAQAATNLDRKVEVQPADTFLGIAYSVNRTIEIPGAFTDEDWVQLVSKLHDTYRVHGNISKQGALRKWRANGIEVLVEPAGNSHRIRLNASSEYHRGLLVASPIFFAMGLFFLALVAAKGDLFTVKAMFVSMFSIVGAGMFGGSTLMLSKWRKEQEAKMDAIGLYLSSKHETHSAAMDLETADSETAVSKITTADHTRVLDVEFEDERGASEKISNKTRVR